MNAVIISQQGAGTNLLRAFLNSHPDVVAYDELFCIGKKRGWEVYDKTKESVQGFLDRKGAEAPNKIRMFDLKYNQLFGESYSEDLIKYIQRNDLLVIHLMRDPARTFFRHIKAGDGRMFNHTDVKAFCEAQRKNEIMTRHLFSSIAEITYEEMTLGKEVTELNDIFENKLVVDILGLKLEKKLSIDDSKFIHRELIVAF